MTELFDMKLRALRRNRAARLGPELFLAERLFDDCLERIAILGRRFDGALLIGCPDPGWRERLQSAADTIDIRDPSPLLAERARGTVIVEDAWEPGPARYDLVLAVGTLDTVNDLPLALRLIRYAMRPDGLFMGAFAGGESLPRLRAAMRAADAIAGGAAPHVHPRIEPSALAPLLADAGFVKPVVDIDRVQLSYLSLRRLVTDLRAMGATNVLHSRAAPLAREQLRAAERAFAADSEAERTLETVEILHFAGWSPPLG